MTMTPHEVCAELVRRGYQNPAAAEEMDRRHGGRRVTVEDGTTLLRVEADSWEAVLAKLPPLEGK